MPLYEFQCRSCGLRFEKRIPVARRQDPVVCDCGTNVQQLVPPSVAGHFTKEVSGPVPQNTGIHDLDTHIDRVIGQSSAQGWKVAQKRKQVKEEVIHSTGASGKDLSRNPDGSYRVLSPQERSIHQRGQAIHSAAGDWRRRQRR